jgi:hypothetical protein
MSDLKVHFSLHRDGEAIPVIDQYFDVMEGQFAWSSDRPVMDIILHHGGSAYRLSKIDAEFSIAEDPDFPLKS